MFQADGDKVVEVIAFNHKEKEKNTLYEQDFLVPFLFFLPE